MVGKYWVDPPAGWRYGFPAVWDSLEEPSLREFFLKKGYPEKDIELALKYYRSWRTDG
jgi:hypothetical protein